MLLRRPQPEEHDSVRAVVEIVVDEIYGGLWASPPLPVDEKNWHFSWVAGTSNYFRLLGAQVLLGHTLGQGDNVPGCRLAIGEAHLGPPRPGLPVPASTAS